MENYVLRNYMLELLTTYLPVYLDEHRHELGEYACSPEFILRFKAAALNRLPSKYITSTAGAVYSAFSMRETQNKVDLIAALSIASREVMNEMRSPREEAI